MCSNKTTPSREFNLSDNMVNKIINNDEADEDDDDDDDSSRIRRRKSNSSSLFDEDDFVCFLDKLSKEKIKYESFSFYNLWFKHYSESKSLFECNIRFDNAMKQMQIQAQQQIDTDDNDSNSNSNSNSTNNINSSIILDDSIPDHYKGIRDAYKEYGIGYFFEGSSSNKGGDTSAYFEEYRNNNSKGVDGTNNKKAIKSVDPLMEIWMEESSNDDYNDEPPILHSSNSREPSRMDTKFKGRNNDHNSNYVTEETTTTATSTTATATATIRPITPDNNNNDDNDDDDDDDTNDNRNHNNGNNGRVYMELTDNDVVFGRGGKANHHLGNIRYRNEIQRFEKFYKSAVTRSEKECIVDTFVQCIQLDGTTNFLEKESKGKGNTTSDTNSTNCDTNCNSNCWFVVDDNIVRRKVHQAFRENRDPEKRKAKRRRFLAKKAAAAAKNKNKTKVDWE
jgi:hypothetical protein